MGTVVGLTSLQKHVMTLFFKNLSVYHKISKHTCFLTFDLPYCVRYTPDSTLSLFGLSISSSRRHWPVTVSTLHKVTNKIFDKRKKRPRLPYLLQVSVFYSKSTLSRRELKKKKKKMNILLIYVSFPINLLNIQPPSPIPRRLVPRSLPPELDVCS